MDSEKQKRIDEASEHPYECNCAKCKEWWEAMPPEDDGSTEMQEDCEREGGHVFEMRGTPPWPCTFCGYTPELVPEDKT